MKILGIIFIVIGLLGCIIFGIQAIGDSESFKILGMDIAVSTANWTPLIVSAVIAAIGIFVMRVPNSVSKV
jgi:hypothetical protein